MVTPVFHSSDPALEAGWQWAVGQALAYVRHGDPVGDWFEAALPGRNAFCMRDVAHQTTGAQALGLRGEVKNMLRRFAENVAESRDWCSYWEITGDNLPAPVDYDSDSDFWYNLPASFDVLHACWRQYLWTGYADYLNDPDFVNFYDRTVNDYVRRWDSDGDGLLEHLPQYGRRGIGSYEEGVSDIRMGADLLAAQFAAYDAYAQIQALRCDAAAAVQFRTKAADLRARYESGWWNARAQDYYSIQRLGGKFAPETNFGINTFALYFGLVQDAERVGRVMANLRTLFAATNVESQSYFPEVAYAYGGSPAAYDALRHLTAPDLPRREYPEVSYSVVGALVTGMMGVHGDAPTRTITTQPRLTDATAWASIDRLSVLDTEISLKHQGITSTTLSAEGGMPFTWEARFAGTVPALLVDGVPKAALHSVGADGCPLSSIAVPVRPGEPVTVAVPS